MMVDIEKTLFRQICLFTYFLNITMY